CRHRGTSTRAALRGVSGRIIMVGLNGRNNALVATKEITSVEQLRGKVVGGYTAQATVNVILTELMRRKGLRPEEYKILNVGTARLAALTAGNVPAAVLNGLETVYAVRQGFRVLARAAEVIELSTGGLGASVANLQSKRDVYRTVIQAYIGVHSDNRDSERKSATCADETAIAVTGGRSIDLRRGPLGMGIGRQAYSQRD